MNNTFNSSSNLFATFTHESLNQFVQFVEFAAFELEFAQRLVKNEPDERIYHKIPRKERSIIANERSQLLQVCIL